MKRRCLFRLGIIMVLMTAAIGGATFAQDACRVKASTYTEECEEGQVRTMVFASNTCTCDAQVNINLEGGGMDVLLTKKNGGTARDMIQGCARKALSITYSFELMCPADKNSKNSEPISPTGKPPPNQLGSANASDVKRLEAAKNRNSQLEATNGRERADFDNKIKSDTNETVERERPAREAQERQFQEKNRQFAEARNADCSQDEGVCRASCITGSSRRRNYNSYKNGYVGESLVSAIESSCSDYCSGRGSICRNPLLVDMGDLIVAKTKEAASNYDRLMAMFNSRVDAHNSDLRRRQMAEENERESAEALNALGSFLTGFVNAYSSGTSVQGSGAIDCIPRPYPSREYDCQ